MSCFTNIKKQMISQKMEQRFIIFNGHVMFYRYEKANGFHKRSS